MLEDFLQDIYDKALTLELLKETSFYSNLRHVFNRRDLWNEAAEHLEKILYDIKDSDYKNASELMQSAEKVQKSYKQRHVFTSLVDTEVIPKVAEYLTRFSTINATEGGWTLESSQTGFLTLKNSSGEYVHNPYDPMWESFLYAYSIFDPTAKRYCVLGGGLGYLAYHLWRLSEGEADIYVYEVDETIGVFSDPYSVYSSEGACHQPSYVYSFDLKSFTFLGFFN